jgi:hypothetical protein
MLVPDNIAGIDEHCEKTGASGNALFSIPAAAVPADVFFAAPADCPMNFRFAAAAARPCKAHDIVKATSRDLTLAVLGKP